MTLAGSNEGPTSGFDDLQLHQELEDMVKHLEGAPVAALSSDAGFRAGTDLHELLGSMLTTAARERTCPGTGLAMYPSNAHGDEIQCPACERWVHVGWQTVADRDVRIIGEHSPCR